MIVTCRSLNNRLERGHLGNQLITASAVISHGIKTGKQIRFPKWDMNKFLERPFDEYSPEELQTDFDYKEPRFNFDEIPLYGSLNLNGYFQSWKYFNDVLDEIRFSFLPKNSILNSVKSSINQQLNLTYEEIFRKFRITSCHIRRGDFLQFSRTYVNLLDSTDYYETAIKLLGGVTDYFLVFSNDIEYCKVMFPDERFIFCESVQETTENNSSEFSDFILQTLCTNNIIANSSYSYMAAMLNKNPDKIVIAPGQWFTKSSGIDGSDMIPKNWMVV